MPDRTDRPRNLDDAPRPPGRAHDAPADRPSADRSGPVSAGTGGAVGGAAGAAAGAAAGTLTLGPIGTILGALAGAVGGGWAGLAAAQEPGPGDADEAFYREHHRSTGAHLADVSYDRVRPAYHLGHAAARNPDYRGRAWTDVEPDLRRGWTADVGARHGEWTAVREHARVAYERAARDPRASGAQPSAAVTGTSPTHARASAADPLAPDAPVAGNPSDELR